MAAATYLSRALTVVFFPNLPLPGFVRKGFRHIPAAVIAALVVPSLVMPEGVPLLPWRNPDLLAGLIAAVTAVRTGSVPITLFAGVAAAALLRRIM